MAKLSPQYLTFIASVSVSILISTALLMGTKWLDARAAAEAFRASVTSPVLPAPATPPGEPKLRPGERRASL